MKKIRFTLFLLLSIVSMSVFGVDKVEKIVGAIATRAQTNRFGPDGLGYYGFQYYERLS